MSTIEPVKTVTSEPVAFKSRFVKQNDNKSSEVATEVTPALSKMSEEQNEPKVDVEKQLKAYQAYANITK